MICQLCGVEAPTQDVSFHQNVGLVVVRFHKYVEGRLCKRCIHREFWKKSLVCVVLGWWGVVSLVVTPFFLLNNIVRYAMCLRLAPVPAGASTPTLDERAVQRLDGVAERMIERLHRGESVEDVMKAAASLAGVTPGQAHIYLGTVVASGRGPSPQH